MQEIAFGGRGFAKDMLGMFLLLLVEKWVHSKKNVYYAISNLFLETTVRKRRN